MHQVDQKWICWTLKTKLIFYIRTLFVPRSKYSISVLKTNLLVLYKANTAVCSEIHTTHEHNVKTTCNVKPGGTLNYRQALKGSMACVVICTKQISCDKERAHWNFPTFSAPLFHYHHRHLIFYVVVGILVLATLLHSNVSLWWFDACASFSHPCFVSTALKEYLVPYVGHNVLFCSWVKDCNLDSAVIPVHRTSV